MPETNHVATLYTVAAILLLQCMAHVMLFAMLNVVYFTSVLPAVCVCAVPGMAVLCSF